MSLLSAFAQYADSGTASLFDLINDLLEHHINSKQKSCKVPTVVAKNVAEHLIKVIADYADVDRTVRAWSALSFLCDRLCNSNCFDILVELQSTAILSYAARSITAGDEEAQFCYKFLLLFSRADSSRQILIGETEGLVEAHMAFFGGKFEQSYDQLRIPMLNLTTNLLGRSRTSTHVNINKFVACGGLQIVYLSIQSTRRKVQFIQARHSSLTSFEEIIHSCMMCLSSVCVAMTYVNDVSAYELTVSRASHEFDKMQLSVLTDTVYFFSTILEELVRIKDGSFILILSFCEYIRVTRRELLEETLLYAGDGRIAIAGTAGRTPMVVIFIRIKRDPRLAHYNDLGYQQLRLYSELLPSIMIGWEEEFKCIHADELVRGPSVDACAYPGCTLNYANCGGGLKRCARCKAVAYCGKEHQTMHWKAHKPTCVSL